MTRPVLLLVLIFLAPTSVRSEVYGGNPSAVMSLGRGFDPAKVDPKAECVGETAPDQPGPRPGGRTTWDSSIIKSQKDLHRQFHIDASLDATIGFSNLSSSFTLDRAYAYGSSDLVWVLKAYQDYGQKSFREPKLNDYGRSFTTIDDFKEVCGTEYVFSEHRIAQISVLFEMHDLSEAQREAVATKVQAAASSGISSGKFQVEVKDLLTSATQTSSVAYQIWALGGDGINKLVDSSGLQGSQLDDLASRIEGYISSFTFDNSFSVEFTTKSYKGLRRGVTAPSFNPTKDRLSDLFYPYLAAAADADRLSEILQAINTAPGGFLSKQDILQYQAQLVKVRANRDALGSAGIRCLNGKSCDTPSITPVQIRWPRGDPDCKEWNAAECMIWIKKVTFVNQGPGTTLRITVDHLPDGFAEGRFTGKVMVTQGRGEKDIYPLQAYTRMSLMPVASSGSAECPADALCTQELRSQTAWVNYNLHTNVKVENHTATFVVALEGCDYTFSGQPKCTTSDDAVVTIMPRQ